MKRKLGFIALMTAMTVAASACGGGQTADKTAVGAGATAETEAAADNALAKQAETGGAEGEEAKAADGEVNAEAKAGKEAEADADEKDSSEDGKADVGAAADGEGSEGDADAASDGKAGSEKEADAAVDGEADEGEADAADGKGLSGEGKDEGEGSEGSDSEGDEGEAEAAASKAESGDAGRYEIYEYEGNGTKVTHEMLVQAGMGDTYLELYEDGTGEFNLFQTIMEVTWKPGIVTVYGTTNYTYEIEGDTMILDMVGIKYTMRKTGAAIAASSDNGADDQESGSLSTDSIDKDSSNTDAAGDGSKEGVDANTDSGNETAVWNGLYTKFVGDSDDARNTDDSFTLELYPDGTGVHHRDDLDIDVKWSRDGDEFTMTETFIGTIDYTGNIKDGQLHLFNGDPEDIWTCEYVYEQAGGVKPDAGENASEPSEGADSGEAASESAAVEETDAVAASAEDVSSGNASTADEAAQEASAGRPEGVPGGDGIVSEEMVQRAYVWLNKVNKDPFNTTYEDLAAFFGVEGEFDKEEYSEHMGVNKRYYKWISEDDNTHFLYVNFDEKEEGVYKVSSYNTSGFLGSEATEKYLEVLQNEAREADKAAAATMSLKDFSVEIHPFGQHDDVVTLSMGIPESGWAYDESRDHLVENEDVNTFGAGFIAFKLEDKVEDFDFYKDKFENYAEIEDRVIGGVTFKGRTYKNIGYEWTEYIAQIDDAHALSVGAVRVDLSEGTIGDRILDSLTIG